MKKQNYFFGILMLLAVCIFYKTKIEGFLLSEGDGRAHHTFFYDNEKGEEEIRFVCVPNDSEYTMEEKDTMRKYTYAYKKGWNIEKNGSHTGKPFDHATEYFVTPEGLIVPKY